MVDNERVGGSVGVEVKLLAEFHPDMVGRQQLQGSDLEFEVMAGRPISRGCG